MGGSSARRRPARAAAPPAPGDPCPRLASVASPAGSSRCWPSWCCSPAAAAPTRRQADRADKSDGDARPARRRRRAPRPPPIPASGAAQVGNCTRMTSAQSGPRSRRRAGVAAAAGTPPSSPTSASCRRPVSAATPVARRDALGQQLCAPAYRQLVGGTLADRATSLLTWTLFTPGEHELERGARWVRCDVVARSGDKLVPLPPGRPLLAQGGARAAAHLPDHSTAPTSPAPSRTPSGSRRSSAPPARPIPDASTYTATARDRCQQLIGLLRRLLAAAEPGRMGRRRPVHPLPGPRPPSGLSA